MDITLSMVSIKTMCSQWIKWYLMINPRVNLSMAVWGLSITAVIWWFVSTERTMVTAEALYRDWRHLGKARQVTAPAPTLGSLLVPGPGLRLRSQGHQKPGVLVQLFISLDLFFGIYAHFYWSSIRSNSILLGEKYESEYRVFCGERSKTKAWQWINCMNY